MENLPQILTDMGLPGLIIGALGWVAWQKDRQLRDTEREKFDFATRQIESNNAVQQALRDLANAVTQIGGR